MYSITFALTVIIGIAGINLFFGFATALLIGRGPKKWSDVEQAVVLRPVALRLPRWRRRKKPKRTRSKRAKPSKPSADPSSAAADASDDQKAKATDTDHEVERQDAASSTETAVQEPVGSDSKKFVLALNDPAEGSETDPPEKTLGDQLDTWRDGPLSNEKPSMSGIRVLLERGEPDDTVRDAMAEAVHTHIKGQVRRNRQVLKIGRDQFCWFSFDVSPQDALRPIERIRQQLAKTRFLHQGDSVIPTLVAGVVIGLQEDDGESLLTRLNTTLQYALDKKEHATCLDIGQGAEGVRAFEIEVEQTDCEL